MVVIDVGVSVSARWAGLRQEIATKMSQGVQGAGQTPGCVRRSPDALALSLGKVWLDVSLPCSILSWFNNDIIIS